MESYLYTRLNTPDSPPGPIRDMVIRCSDGAYLGDLTKLFPNPDEPSPHWGFTADDGFLYYRQWRDDAATVLDYYRRQQALDSRAADGRKRTPREMGLHTWRLALPPYATTDQED